MKYLIVGVVMALPLLAWGADNPDAAFYKNAAEGGMAEVELGNLAQNKNANASVKDYGAMMVMDHSAANEKLKSIAAGKGVKLPTSPSVSQMATKAKLEVLTGQTFDDAFIKAMIKDHEGAVALFRRESANGQDPEAKAFATATLPTLQAHLKKIQSIATAAGVKAD